MTKPDAAAEFPRQRRYVGGRRWSGETGKSGKPQKSANKIRRSGAGAEESHLSAARWRETKATRTRTRRRIERPNESRRELMPIRRGRPRPRAACFSVLANRSSRGCGKTPRLSVAVATCATCAIYRRCASIRAFATRARARDRLGCVRTNGSYVDIMIRWVYQQFLWIANLLMDLMSFALTKRFIEDHHLIATFQRATLYIFIIILECVENQYFVVAKIL